MQKITYPLPFLRLSYLLYFGQKLVPTKMQRLLKVAELLPDNSATSGLYPAKQPSSKSLQLFIGCVSSKADYSAIDAAIQVLTRIGFAVEIPAKQTCCGALHLHNGYAQQAEQLCVQNRLQTKASRAEGLITLASACQLELTKYKASKLPVFR